MEDTVILSELVRNNKKSICIKKSIFTPSLPKGLIRCPRHVYQPLKTRYLSSCFPQKQCCRPESLLQLLPLLSVPCYLPNTFHLLPVNFNNLLMVAVRSPEVFNIIVSVSSNIRVKDSLMPLICQLMTLLF